MKPQEEKAFDELMKGLEPEQPSMRFTKNVMEAIDGMQVAPASKRYVNSWIIKGIAAFFIISLTVLLGYSLFSINWHETNASSMYTSKLPAIPQGAMLNGFIAINVILLLILTDKLLNRRRLHTE